MLSINRQWITELMVLGMWIFHNFFVFLQCLFFGFSSLVPFSSSWRRRWWFWWMTLIWCWKIIYTKIVVTVCSDVDVNCILFYDIRYPLGNASLTVRINVSLLVFLSIITNESNKKKKNPILTALHWIIVWKIHLFDLMRKKKCLFSHTMSLKNFHLNYLSLV